MDISKCNKFKLLMWKNFLTQRNHKLQFILEILIVLILFAILASFRYEFKIKQEPMIEFNPLSISNLDLYNKHTAHLSADKKPSMELIYSPKNFFLDDIVKNAAASLGLELKSVDNAAQLELELTTGNYLAGIQFEDYLASLTTYPKKLAYALRMHTDLRTNSNETWKTCKLFMYVPHGARNPNDHDGGVPVGYLREGFLPIQNAMAISFIKIKGGLSSLPEIQLQRFPYPEYLNDTILERLQMFLPLFIVGSFMLPLVFITLLINREKQKPLKELMKCMGVYNWLHWTSWFVHSLILLVVLIILFILLLKIPFLYEDPACLNNSDPTALFIVLLVYCITCICFCFMIAAFFYKPIAAAITTGCIYLIALQPIEKYDGLSLCSKLVFCIDFNMSLSYAILIILRHEMNGAGLQWHNLFTPATPDDSLCVGLTLIMLLLVGAVFMLICLYVEQIYPGMHGVPRPWNFPFTISFWQALCWRKRRNDISTSSSSSSFDDEPKPKINLSHFQAKTRDQTAFVQMKRLHKHFQAKTAVHDLTMNLYRNEVTVLVGHKGAGKSTLISLLAGQLRPSGGMITINGFDTHTNPEEAERTVGLCTQVNSLFNDLTVAHQLEFFSSLKGFKEHNLEIEVDKYVRFMELENNANLKTSRLSRGMKRLLAVCCALCGNSKVVLLDEPSKGMESRERHKLWNLLKAERAGRVILVTTELIAEAEILGDRIGIMCRGELRCYGTSQFLRRIYSSGHHLVCVKRDRCNVQLITELLQKYIPDIQPISDVGGDLSYKMPESYNSIFVEMLRDLENHVELLNLYGFGIGYTNLQEVFCKAGSDQFSGGSPSTEVELPNQRADNIYGRKLPLLTGTALLRKKWRAMILKKFLYSVRHKHILFFQIFFPVLSALIVIFLLSIFGKFDQMKPISLNLIQYDGGVLVLETEADVTADSENGKISKAYKTILDTRENHDFTMELTGALTFPEYILNLGRKPTMQTTINSRYLAAATIARDKITVWLNNHALHTAPLTLNVLHNAIVYAHIGTDHGIEVKNAPLPYNTEKMLELLQTFDNINFVLMSQVGCGIFIVTAINIMHLIEERVSRAKYLQISSGVHISTYWLSHFLWDMLIYFIVVMFLTVIFDCLKMDGYKTIAELSTFLLILSVYGFSVMPTYYVVSFIFRKPEVGCAVLIIFNIVAGSILFLVIMYFATDGNSAWQWQLLAPHALLTTLNNLSLMAYTNDACNNPDVTILADNVRCQVVPICCSNHSYFVWESPGLLTGLTCMFTTGVVFIMLLVIIESAPFISKQTLKQITENNENVDADVAGEKQRIIAMSPKERENFNLVVDRMTKAYKKNTVVNQISFTVKSAECFGLIGVHGSGKTTTLKMLSGDIKITKGFAYVKGMSVKSEIREIYKDFSYCPKKDAFINDLSGRENFKIFALLRGLPSKYIYWITQELANAFKLSKLLDTPAKEYTSGNRRKLSVAIALLGNPSVIYLDEPTIDVDPVSKSQLWAAICDMRAAGKSILLTTTNMEECKALCTRLGILVKGELLALGTTRSLKTKLCKGFVLKIKYNLDQEMIESLWNRAFSAVAKWVEKPAVEENNENQLPSTSKRDSLRNDTKSLKEFMLKTYPDAILQEEYEGNLNFYIPLGNRKWSDVFKTINENRQRFFIEDFSISQTTLEEVVLGFSKQ